MKPHSLTIALLTAILFVPSGLYGQALDYSQLVSLWRLNGNAADSVGPNNGSWAGTAAYDAGPKPGTTAAVFEGSNFIHAGKGIAFDAEQTRLRPRHGSKDRPRTRPLSGG